ncbi:MAG: DUF1800 domain-containing protein, partial [Comamonas sp.]
MQQLHIFFTRSLACIAVTALAACAPLLSPSQSRLSPQTIETVSNSRLPDKTSAMQRQQWLDRVTWGATDHES